MADVLRFGAAALALSLARGCDLCDGLDREDSAVVRLTSNSLDEAIAAHPVVLLGFYAPWCEVCKWFAPTYEALALDLQSEGVLVAKVNAADQTYLARRFGVEVTRSPVIKIVRRGHVLPYMGSRAKGDLLAAVRAHALPAVADLGIDADVDVEAAFEDRIPASGSGALARCALAGEGAAFALDLLDEVAGAMAADGLPFASRRDSRVAAGCDLRVIRRWASGGGDEPRTVVYRGPWTFTHVRDWARWRAAPMAAPLTRDTVHRYLRHGYSAVVAISADMSAEAQSAITRAAIDVARERADAADRGALPVWISWFSKDDALHARLAAKLHLRARASTQLVALNVTGPGIFVAYTQRGRGVCTGQEARDALRTHVDSFAAHQLRADMHVFGIDVFAMAAALVFVVVVAAVLRTVGLKRNASAFARGSSVGERRPPFSAAPAATGTSVTSPAVER